VKGYLLIRNMKPEQKMTRPGHWERIRGTIGKGSLYQKMEYLTTLIPVYSRGRSPRGLKKGKGEGSTASSDSSLRKKRKETAWTSGTEPPGKTNKNSSSGGSRRGGPSNCRLEMLHGRPRIRRKSDRVPGMAFSVFNEANVRETRKLEDD